MRESKCKEKCKEMNFHEWQMRPGPLYNVNCEFIKIILNMTAIHTCMNQLVFLKVRQLREVLWTDVALEGSLA